MPAAVARRMDPERRREQLLDVASDYIAANGTAVSLDDIAHEAGISPPLMRHYFKNREGLLATLTERATRELEGIFLSRDGGDLAERVARYLDWVVDHQWGHWLWIASSGNSAVADFGLARRRLAEATVGTRWDEQDTAMRVRANAWIATIEATVSAWLDAGHPDPEPTIDALLDIAVRLDVVGAKQAVRKWRRRASRG